MIRTILMLLLLALFSGCQPEATGPAPTVPAGIAYESGDGLSFSTAVVIRGATEETGVRAEYAWLGQRYPGYRMRKQSLEMHGNKTYDVFEITTREGGSKKVYFDISEFFRKL